MKRSAPGGMNFMRRNLISALQELADSGVIVVVCSQCLYESCDFSIYQTGMRLVEHNGIIQAKDMTTEAAVHEAHVVSRPVHRHGRHPRYVYQRFGRGDRLRGRRKLKAPDNLAY